MMIILSNLILHIIPLPAFDDNYIWLLHNTRQAVVVDPGDASPVIAALKQQELILSHILITHHHSDHIDGVAELLKFSPTTVVYAPSYEQYHFPHIALKDNDVVFLQEINQTFRIMHLPGHTLGHIAYVNDETLLCGDTLFGAGCGRLFEGSPTQMLSSLNRLKQLNKATKVYCTHEYTAKNIAFALTLEPSNADLITRQEQVQNLRAQQSPSLPSTIGLERLTNPYFRCKSAEIIANSQSISTDELSVFTNIRTLRNHY